jgi:undecaprenyl-diphosphatase
MTQESIQPFLDWISTHPTWSGFAVFLISLSESLAIVGLFVPGVVLMTAIGGMMGTGHLPFFATLCWAIFGAIIGDGISYWLGHHYHQRLRQFWPFKQFPNLLARGETFFRHHGGKSIVFSRFAGPMRPMIPVIAGMLDMPPKRFLFFNVLSAIIWAPLYSLPGILIGSSLGKLSPETASRAGLLVLLFLLALWLLYEFLLLITFWIGNTCKKIVNQIWLLLSRLHGLHYILRTHLGTEQGQLGILFLALLALGSFTSIYTAVINFNGIALWNEPLYQIFRTLYLDQPIAFTSFFTALGDPKVLLPAVVAVGIWLRWHKQRWATLCWFMTIGGGLLLGTLIKIYTAIPRPEGLAYSSHEYSFPSGHALTATITYCLTAAFIQNTISTRHRCIPWAIVIPLIFLISLSRVYLGVHWFTDILGGITLGIFCISLGTFFYRRHYTRPLPNILLPGILVTLITFSIYNIATYSHTRKALIRQWHAHTLHEKLWWQGKSDINKLYRAGALRQHATLFDLQWLGSLHSIKKTLIHLGWQPLQELNFKNGVMLLASNPPPQTFPVMPKFHRNRLPVLVVVKILNQSQRLVLQLWQSDYASAKEHPLWVGTLRLEEANHPLPLVTLYLETQTQEDFIKQLSETLKHAHVQTQILHFLKNEQDERASEILLLRSS